MGAQNKRPIKQVQNNPSLLYGVDSDDPTKARPIEVDSSGQIVTSGGSGSDDNAIHDNVADEITAIAEKAVPVNADVLVIEDSEAANVKKKVQLGNLPGTGGNAPRSATYFVAASDATADEIAGADYVCDGTLHTTWLESCEDVWDTIDEDVVASFEEVDYKVGTGCLKLVVGVDCSAGDILASSTFSAVDLSSRETINFYLKSSTALSNGDIQILLSDAGGIEETLNVVAQDADTWYHPAIYLAAPADCDAIINVSIKMNVDKGAFTLYIDAISSQYADEYEIQQAIVAAETNGVGTIQLSSGTFDMKVGCYLVPNITIQGQGIDVTTLQLHADVLDVEAGYRYRSSLFHVDKYDYNICDVMIRDMTLDGNSANQDQNADNALLGTATLYLCGIGLWNGSYNNSVENVKFKNCASGGLYVESAGSQVDSGVNHWRAEFSVFNNLFFEANGVSSWQSGSTIYRTGLTIDQAFDMKFGNMVFTNEVHGAIYIYESTGITISGLLVNCPAGYGMYFSSGVGHIYINNFQMSRLGENGITIGSTNYMPGPIYITDGRMLGVGTHNTRGIEFGSGVSDVHIDKVIMDGFHKGILYSSSGNDRITITNCDIANMYDVGAAGQGTGIRMDGSYGSVIKNNRIRNCDQYQMEIDDCTYCTIEGNELTGYVDEATPALTLSAGASAGASAIYCSTANFRFREGDFIRITEGGNTETHRILYIEKTKIHLALDNTLDNDYTVAAVLTFEDAAGTTISEQGTTDYMTYKDNLMMDGTFTLLGTHNTYDRREVSAEIDLSAAATDVVVHHATKPGILCGYRILYTEASSADAGVSIDVGRYQSGVALDDDYFDTTTSEASKDLGYSTYINKASLTNTVIATGDTITVGTAGGKTGTGKVRVYLDIMEGYTTSS